MSTGTWLSNANVPFAKTSGAALPRPIAATMPETFRVSTKASILPRKIGYLSAACAHRGMGKNAANAAALEKPMNPRRPIIFTSPDTFLPDMFFRV